MGLDALGDLILMVGGDLSPLQDALDAVPSVAQTAGDAINSALTGSLDAATASLANLNSALDGLGSGSAAALSILDDQMNLFAEDANKTADALAQIPPQLEMFSSGELQNAASGFSGIEQNASAAATATHEAGAAAEETGGSFGELSEHLIQTLEKLGVMITVWEALKTSMEAVGKEQAFSVSMEALTGSAQTAEETMKELEATATRLPVAFDSLLDATQRMQAFGIATEEIPHLLTAAADAAAASGQSFDAVANALERVQVTGQVMARSLMQMGVTWKQVADQMGVSIEEAQAAFKKGAQSAAEDVEILTRTIEANYGGMSERLADTIGGQFQILKNQLIELAGAFGAILAPIASGLMQIVGGIAQTLIDFFNGLRETFGTLTPAASNLADALGVLAIGIGAIMVAASAALGPWGLLVAALGAAAEVMSALSDHAQAAADKEEKLAEARRMQTEDIKAEQQAADNLSAVLARHGMVVQQAGMDVDAFSRKLQGIWDDFEKTSDMVNRASVYWQLYKGVLSDLYPTLDAFKKAMEEQLVAIKKAAQDEGVAAISSGYKQLQSNLTTAKAYLDQVTEAWHNHQAGLGQVQAAQAAVDKAQAALNGKFDTTVTTLGKMEQAFKPLAVWPKTVIETANAYEDALVVMNGFAAAAAKLPTLTALTTNEIKLQNEYLNQNGEALQKVLAAATKLPEQYKQAGEHLRDVDDAWKQIVPDAKDVSDVVEGINANIGKTALTTDQLNAMWNNLLSAAKGDAEELQKVLALMNAQRAPIEYRLMAEKAILEAAANQAIYYQQGGAALLQVSERMAAVNQQLQIWHDRTYSLSEMYKKMLADFSASWTELSNGIANAIASGQNFGQVFTKVLDDLKKKILEDIVGRVMTQLKDAILENGEVLKGWNTLFNGIFGAGGDVAKGFADSAKSAADFGKQFADSTKQAADAMKDAASQIKSTMQDTTASVHSSAASMVADLNLIATAIGAIASIFSAIELMHTNTLLGRIEESTRRTDITIEGIGTAAWTTINEQLPVIRALVAQMWPEVYNSEQLLEDIDANMQTAAKALLQIMTVGIAGGGGGSADSSNIIAALEDAFAQQSGLLYQIQQSILIASAGSNYSPIILGAGGAGGGGSITTVVGAGTTPIPGTGTTTTPPGGIGVLAPGSTSPTLPPGTTTPGAVPGVASTTVTVNATVNAGTVVGAGGAQALATTVGNMVMDNFRRAGMRF